jgi:large conductance mechanosensitive channel
MGFLREFMDFMQEQKIVSVALAFIVGLASVALIQALVRDLITPIYGPYLTFLNPNVSVTVGLSQFMVGDFILQLISFIVMLLVVFFIGRALNKK